jgi:hypothetical protein
MIMKFIAIFLVFTQFSFASIREAEQAYNQRGDKASKYGKIAQALVRSKLYYSAVPFFKEFIIRGGTRNNSSYQRNLDLLIHHVGIKTFETMPTESLARTRGNTINYILAKKYFTQGNYTRSQDYANKIGPQQRSYPYALNIKASIATIKGNHSSAIKIYDDCIDESNAWLKEYKTKQRRTELKANRDYCIAGKARARFASRDFDKADLAYLDLAKTSYIWPEILLEEAWNSYYQGNYNRTLGKLVSYKAPLLDYNFYPEGEVLKAMSYLKMCLYQDAKATADEFYKKYKSRGQNMKSLLMRLGNSNTKYFNLFNKGSNNSLVNRFIKRVRKDMAVKQLIDSLAGMIKESEKLSMVASGGFAGVLRENIRQQIKSHKKIIGAYTRSKLRQGYFEIVEAFSGMSYLKLEILKMRKKQLYSSGGEKDSGKRGDVKYVPRNEKQYFWDFNGEFWADELGDYVFALKSEC